MLYTIRFDCPRTCPLAGERWCRFRPVTDKLGPVRANSHTARIKVDYSDADALKAAVAALGGNWLGHGIHRLYEGPATGYGFRLPGWTYPIVLQEGELSFDDFGGVWGNVADLERLRGAYVIAVAEKAALAQGWQCEHTEGGLTIYHPSGGTLTVTGGAVDANGFQGQGCHEAILALGLPVQDLQAKAEYAQTAAKVALPT